MCRFRIAVIERLNQLLCITEATYKELIKVATTQAQMDQQLDLTVQISQNLGIQIGVLIADLEAKANGSAIDFTPELTKLQAIQTALLGTSDAATNADPNATLPPASVSGPA